MSRTVSTKKNIWYQTLYQILNVCLPLVTAPFLARVLGAEPLGIMSYTGSVVHYFTLFAMMGLANYGTRSIAFVKDNKEQRNIVFSQIYYLQIITTGIAFLAYIGYLFVFCGENKLIAWIQGIAVFACFFDISWFFFGIEEFKITVIRSVIIRITSVVLILFLVRKPTDLWIYALLLIGSTLCSQMVLWFYVPQYATLKKTSFKELFSHFLPNVKLFIPLLAMSVYHIMDKTMLGMLSTYTESGYYYNADKVINIPIGILTGIVTVLLPRMSFLAGENKKEEMDGLFNTSIRSICLISAAMCCGIAAISKEFTPLFFGKGYDKCVILIIVLAPVLFIKGLSLISRNLYLVPNKREKELTISVLAGAIVNLVLNILLIPKYGAFGAVIGTLCAECVSCVWQYCSLIGKVAFGKSMIMSFFYFAIGMAMFAGVRMVSVYLKLPLFPKVLIEMAIGVFLYGVFCLLFWRVTKNKKEYELLKSFFKKQK